MMNRALLRNLSLYSRNLLHSPPNFKHITGNHHLRVPLTASTRSQISFYSSESYSSTEKNLTQNQSVDFDDVSNEELKKRIDKYLEGDEDAIPSIFEAILSRKLSGKHEESDDELMQEFRQKHATKDDYKAEDDEEKEEEEEEEEEFNSDIDIEFSEIEGEDDTERHDDARRVVLRRRMKD